MDATLLETNSFTSIPLIAFTVPSQVLLSCTPHAHLPPHTDLPGRGCHPAGVESLHLHLFFSLNPPPLHPSELHFLTPTTLITQIYLDVDATLLEMNPFTFISSESAPTPFPLDIRLELDDTARFRSAPKWCDAEFPLPFGRTLDPHEVWSVWKCGRMCQDGKDGGQ